MPLDIYDYTHCYDNIFEINIYNDSNINNLIDSKMSIYGIKSDSNYLDLKSNIIELINKLKGCLLMLENRHITLIGGRIYYKHNYWIIINVHRGFNPIVIDNNNPFHK
jgi:hypothetical protein